MHGTRVWAIFLAIGVRAPPNVLWGGERDATGAFIGGTIGDEVSEDVVKVGAVVTRGIVQVHNRGCLHYGVCIANVLGGGASFFRAPQVQYWNNGGHRCMYVVQIAIRKIV